MNELNKLVYPNGHQVEYHYDEYLKLTSLNDGNDKVSYHYDNKARLETKITSNTKTSFTYDTLDRLNSIKHHLNDDVIEN